MNAQRPPDWHRLSYADSKLEGLLRDLERVAADDLRPAEPLVEDATLPERLEALDTLPVSDDDLPDDESRTALARYREWTETMGGVRDSAARLAAAKQAERWLRDLAARVRAALKRQDEDR
jgi:hypothetical protein